jgi:hypothetical protein
MVQVAKDTTNIYALRNTEREEKKIKGFEKGRASQVRLRVGKKRTRDFRLSKVRE